MKGLLAAVTLAFVANASARTFTVYNNCPFTIWYVPNFLLPAIHLTYCLFNQACGMKSMRIYLVRYTNTAC